LLFIPFDSPRPLCPFIYGSCFAQNKVAGQDPKHRARGFSMKRYASWRVLLALPLFSMGPLWAAVDLSPDQGFNLNGKRLKLEPIVNPPVKPAREAPAVLSPSGLVLGLHIGTEARAYPLAMIFGRPNEVVNDTVGGQHVLVTFCGKCTDAVAYSPEVGGRVLTFVSTGQTWQENMVMVDRETNTLWVQMLGLAKQGPLKGTRLRQLPAVWTTWGNWRQRHPETTVLVRKPLRKSPERNDLTAEKFRANPGRFVFGVEAGNGAAAWAFPYLHSHAPVNDRVGGRPVLVTFDAVGPDVRAFSRRVDGRELTFTKEGGRLIDRQTGSAWDPETGRARRGPLRGTALKELPGVVSIWRPWHNIHPGAPITGLLKPAPHSRP
jgi:hypothetical protein